MQVFYILHIIACSLHRKYRYPCQAPDPCGECIYSTSSSLITPYHSLILKWISQIESRLHRVLFLMLHQERYGSFRTLLQNEVDIYFSLMQSLRVYIPQPRKHKVSKVILLILVQISETWSQMLPRCCRASVQLWSSTIKNNLPQ